MAKTRQRWIAALIIAGVVAGGVSAARGVGAVRLPYAPELPFAAPTLAVDGAGTRGPRVLMYVAPDCPFCARELASWAEAVGGGAGPDPLELVLISREPLPATSPLVPSGLRVTRTADPGGAVARALGVRAVPLTVYIDGAGIVRHRTEGATDARRIAAALQRFVEVSHADTR